MIQIGCGYCLEEESCKMRDSKINKAKKGCIQWQHYKDKNKNRYLCVFFTSKNEKTINRNFKKVLVIKADTPSEAEDIIKKQYKATYIKRVRDINVWIYYKNDLALDKIEKINNDKL